MIEFDKEDISVSPEAINDYNDLDNYITVTEDELYDTIVSHRKRIDKFRKTTLVSSLLEENKDVNSYVSLINLDNILVVFYNA